MSFLRPRFWQKVLVALLVVGVVPIALVSAVSINNTRNDLTTLGVTNIQQRSTSTAASIDAYLQSRLGDIVLVGKLPDIVRFGANLSDPAAKNAARQALAAAAARSPEYESVAVVDPNGTIVAASIATDEGTSVKFREYFLTAFKGTPYISDPSYSVITNKPALFFSAPVTDGQKVLAVVRTRVNMAAIWEIVETDQGAVGEGAHGFLVDDYGIRLAVSETKGNRAQAENLIYRPIAPIDTETATKLAADKRFGTKTPDQLIIDPLTTYTKAADDATFNALSVVAIGLLLSFVIGVFLTRSLVGPLRRLVGEATAVSTGDVDIRIAAFDTRAGDDISREVASAFDRMLNALRFYALSDEPTGGDD